MSLGPFRQIVFNKLKLQTNPNFPIIKAPPKEQTLSRVRERVVATATG